MFTPFVLRWIAASVLCALLVTEHGRLALRAKKRWSWLVPLAPAVLAWQRGDRLTLLPSALALVAWLTLRVTG